MDKTCNSSCWCIYKTTSIIGGSRCKYDGICWYQMPYSIDAILETRLKSIEQKPEEVLKKLKED